MPNPFDANPFDNGSFSFEDLFNTDPNQWGDTARNLGAVGDLSDMTDAHVAATGALPDQDTVNSWADGLEQRWGQPTGAQPLATNDNLPQTLPDADAPETDTQTDASDDQIKDLSPISETVDPAESSPPDPEPPTTPDPEQKQPQLPAPSPVKLAANESTQSDASDDIRNQTGEQLAEGSDPSGSKKTPSVTPDIPDSLVEAARKRTEAFENGKRSATSYRDSARNVTFDPGMKIGSADEMAGLDLYKADGTPASESEKRAEYDSIQQGAKGSLTINPDQQDAIYGQRIKEHLSGAAREIGPEAWNKLTDGQKLAAGDIHYANGGLKKFKSFKSALQSSDVPEMANESAFTSPGKKREPVRNEARTRANYADIMGVDPSAPEVTAWFKGLDKK